jgi:fructan beta-fructosidase
MFRFASFSVFSFISLFAFSQDQIYKEQFRPQFHFSSPLHWINDPNGLLYHNGNYHIFYQHNPMGIRWGHMSWGHAISKNLVHWKHLPIAIPEENGVMIFSGSCVADINNTSGFGKNGRSPLVAIYTAHIEGVNQSQHIAYSNDDGLTWTKFEKNPVLDLNKKDFRDPKVFWHDQKKYWVMALMLPVEHIVQFYSSSNLKEWSHLSNFGPVGDTSGVWECPDLTAVPVDGEPGKKKWLLQMSQNASMQYFIGEFDGIKFINESPNGKILRPDYGPDYYAAIAYNQLPSSTLPTAIGWINNWYYAQDIPTMPWRGAMSLPRTLSVKKIKNEWVLIQRPASSLSSLRDGFAYQLKNTSFEGTKSLRVKSQQFEMEITLQPSVGSTSGIKLAVGDNHFFEIGYDAGSQTLYTERANTGNINFHDDFKKRSRSEVTLPLKDGFLILHIFFDNSIVEIFGNNGEAVITMQLFPGSTNSGIELFSNKGRSTIKNLSIWKMRSCW